MLRVLINRWTQLDPRVLTYDTAAFFEDEKALAVQALTTPSAYTELYRRYYSRVFNYVRYRCEDLATAEDLTALKKFILTGLAIWLALASLGNVWDRAFAASQAEESNRTVPISAGKPAEVWFGQAGVYYSNSAYSGKVILTRPAVGTRESPDARLGKQDLAASHRHLEFMVEDSASKQVFVAGIE